uniref:LIM zinc-binding domain-containing protein n=1 Tax=Mesocestoides corti TaxID=53468 RepID=A0A5K3F9V8_MESCO
MDNSPWSCACPPSPSHAFRTLPSSRYALSVCFDAKFRILISQAKTHFFSGKESASAKTENNIDEKKEGRKESEALKAAKEVTKVSQNVADAASVAGATGFRASDIRNRFEKGESFDQEKSKETKKRKTKLKYAGVGSMKDKLLQEANKQVNGSKDPTKLKEITPPREGVAVGVLESQPQARPEGVEGPTTGDATVTDYIGIGKKTKDVRERFRQLEKTGGVIEEEEGEKRTIDPEEFRQATTEATRSAKARWKDIESGKVETRIEKTKVDLGSGIKLVSSKVG